MVCLLQDVHQEPQQSHLPTQQGQAQLQPELEAAQGKSTTVLD